MLPFAVIGCWACNPYIAEGTASGITAKALAFRMSLRLQVGQELVIGAIGLPPIGKIVSEKKIAQPKPAV